MNISQLRRKIEPDRARPRYLLTEPGAGYRLVAPARSSSLQSFFRPPPGTFSPSSAPPSYRGGMAVRTSAGPVYDLAAIGIAAACFAVRVPDPLGAGARLMPAADIFGLVVSLLIFVYLVYALFRGERF